MNIRGAWSYIACGPVPNFSRRNDGCHFSHRRHVKHNRSITGLVAMSSRIQFAEPISKKEEPIRVGRVDTHGEKGSAQRTLSPGNEIVYPTGWRLVLTIIG